MVWENARRVFTIDASPFGHKEACAWVTMNRFAVDTDISLSLSLSLSHDSQFSRSYTIVFYSCLLVGNYCERACLVYQCIRLKREDNRIHYR